MAPTEIPQPSPQINTRYRTEQDDWSGISVIDIEDGKTVATITGCTPEFLAESLAAPVALSTLEQIVHMIESMAYLPDLESPHDAELIKDIYALAKSTQQGSAS